METCTYCDRRAIGLEKEYFDNITWRYPVCSNCAHVNATVYLFDGSTITGEN